MAAFSNEKRVAGKLRRNDANDFHANRLAETKNSAS
jgi:hypothetical protein